jgi:hypothetical protein
MKVELDGDEVDLIKKLVYSLFEVSSKGVDIDKVDENAETGPDDEYWEIRAGKRLLKKLPNPNNRHEGENMSKKKMTESIKDEKKYVSPYIKDEKKYVSPYPINANNIRDALGYLEVVVRTLDDIFLICKIVGLKYEEQRAVTQYSGGSVWYFAKDRLLETMYSTSDEADTVEKAIDILARNGFIKIMSKYHKKVCDSAETCSHFEHRPDVLDYAIVKILPPTFKR